MTALRGDDYMWSMATAALEQWAGLRTISDNGSTSETMDSVDAMSLDAIELSDMHQVVGT